MYWSHRADLDALFDAGDTMRQAIAAGGEGLQAASQIRRAAIDAATRRAISVLESAGHAASTTALRRIGQTLDALAATARQPDAPPPSGG